MPVSFVPPVAPPYPITPQRDSLTLLFDVLGLVLREAGDDGEKGYGVPDRGADDSVAVMRKVRCGILGNFKAQHRPTFTAAACGRRKRLAEL